MNVLELTQDKAYHSIWNCVAVTAILTLFTVGAWTMWSRMFDAKRSQMNFKCNMIFGKAEA